MMFALFASKKEIQLIARIVLGSENQPSIKNRRIAGLTPVFDRTGWPVPCAFVYKCITPPSAE
jgi:hypothetical protein